MILSPPFGTLRALGVRTITRKFAVKKIRTKTCSRNTIPSPLGYLYLPNCMRSKRTIISELVTKWGQGMPYIAYTTWERVQFQNCAEKICNKNWGPESWAWFSFPHIRLECKIPLSEIEAGEDLIKCFQSQIETGRSSIEFFKAEDGEGSLHLWRLKCCKKMMYRCPGLIKDYFVSNICSMKCSFAVDFRKSSHLLPYLLFSLDRLQCQNIKCPVCLSSDTWSELDGKNQIS